MAHRLGGTPRLSEALGESVAIVRQIGRVTDFREGCVHTEQCVTCPFDREITRQGVHRSIFGGYIS